MHIKNAYWLIITFIILTWSTTTYAESSENLLDLGFDELRVNNNDSNNNSQENIPDNKFDFTKVGKLEKKLHNIANEFNKNNFNNSLCSQLEPFNSILNNIKNQVQKNQSVLISVQSKIIQSINSNNGMNETVLTAEQNVTLTKEHSQKTKRLKDEVVQHENIVCAITLDAKNQGLNKTEQQQIIQKFNLEYGQLANKTALANIYVNQAKKAKLHIPSPQNYVNQQAQPILEEQEVIISPVRKWMTQAKSKHITVKNNFKKLNTNNQVTINLSKAQQIYNKALAILNQAPSGSSRAAQLKRWLNNDWKNIQKSSKSITEKAKSCQINTALQLEKTGNLLTNIDQQLKSLNNPNSLLKNTTEKTVLLNRLKQANNSANSWYRQAKQAVKKVSGSKQSAIKCIKIAYENFGASQSIPLTGQTQYGIYENASESQLLIHQININWWNIGILNKKLEILCPKAQANSQQIKNLLADINLSSFQTDSSTNMTSENTELLTHYNQASADKNKAKNYANKISKNLFLIKKTTDKLCNNSENSLTTRQAKSLLNTISNRFSMMLSNDNLLSDTLVKIKNTQSTVKNIPTTNNNTNKIQLQKIKDAQNKLYNLKSQRNIIRNLSDEIYDYHEFMNRAIKKVTTPHAQILSDANTRYNQATVFLHNAEVCESHIEKLVSNIDQQLTPYSNFLNKESNTVNTVDYRQKIINIMLETQSLSLIANNELTSAKSSKIRAANCATKWLPESGANEIIESTVIIESEPNYETIELVQSNKPIRQARLFECSKKYPGSVDVVDYNSKSKLVSCDCPKDGWQWNSNYTKCIQTETSLDNDCRLKWPGTQYDANLNRCVCTGYRMDWNKEKQACVNIDTEAYSYCSRIKPGTYPKWNTNKTKYTCKCTGNYKWHDLRVQCLSPREYEFEQVLAQCDKEKPGTDPYWNSKQGRYVCGCPIGKSYDKKYQICVKTSTYEFQQWQDKCHRLDSSSYAVSNGGRYSCKCYNLKEKFDKARGRCVKKDSKPTQNKPNCPKWGEEPVWDATRKIYICKRPNVSTDYICDKGYCTGRVNTNNRRTIYNTGNANDEKKIKEWKAKLACMLEARKKYPKTSQDCRGRWTTPMRRTIIKDLKNKLRAAGQFVPAD